MKCKLTGCAVLAMALAVALAVGAGPDGVRSGGRRFAVRNCPGPAMRTSR